MEAKLLRKVVEQCKKIAKDEDIPVRQSYKRTIKTLLLKQRFAPHPKCEKEAITALRKIGTIARRLVRELDRKLPTEILSKYNDQLKVYQNVIDQKRTDKSYIYSIHGHETACIANTPTNKLQTSKMLR